MAVAILLSTVTGESMNGDAAIKNFPELRSVDIRALVVCPGAKRMVSVSKGFTYAASTSTTVRL